MFESEEKIKYQNLKAKVEAMIVCLNGCIEKLEVPSIKIDEYYTVDSLSVDNKFLKKEKDNCIYTRNYLKNIILEEIKSNIRVLDITGGE